MPPDRRDVAVPTSRPRVVCHMMGSVDGRIVPDGWPLTDAARRQYELVHASYAPDGWLCGRITMEDFAGGVRADAEVAREHDGGGPRPDFRAPGDRDVDLGLALDKIGARFGVRTLLLEGGGRVNGSMLHAGLVDEVSLLVAPVVDGRPGTPAVFDAEHAAPRRLALEQVERRDGGMLWLRYRVEPDGGPA